MVNIQQNIKHIRHLIFNYETQYQHNPPGCITLLAASKGQSCDAIRQAALAGQMVFGENYLDEALEKIHKLHDLNLEWHFIGRIQSNKTKKIAENFSWIHSICREKIAVRLSKQRPRHMSPLNVCIEVNIDAEPHKDGVTFSKLPALATAIIELPYLKLRGLMAIPKATNDFEQQRQAFAKLYNAYRHLQQQGLSLDTLSMGMSHDFEAAIAEGATIVRIGTAIFGARKSS